MTLSVNPYKLHRLFLFYCRSCMISGHSWYGTEGIVNRKLKFCPVVSNFYDFNSSMGHKWDKYIYSEAVLVALFDIHIFKVDYCTFCKKILFQFFYFKMQGFYLNVTWSFFVIVGENYKQFLRENWVFQCMTCIQYSELLVNNDLNICLFAT